MVKSTTLNGFLLYFLATFSTVKTMSFFPFIPSIKPNKIIKMIPKVFICEGFRHSCGFRYNRKIVLEVQYIFFEESMGIY